MSSVGSPARQSDNKVHTSFAMLARADAVLARFRPHSSDKVLDHYCTAPAAIEILRSATMWASDFLFLNDAHELYDGLATVEGALESYRSPPDKLGGAFHHVARHALGLIRRFLDEGKVRIFGVSLSGSRDDISQWRAYSLHGRGIALGFRSGVLRKLALTSPEPTSLISCLYRAQEKQQFVAEILREYDAVLYEFAKVTFDFGTTRRLNDEAIDSLATQLIVALITILPVFKHAKFEAEAESRLVSWYYWKSNNTHPLEGSLRVRSGVHSLVPYVELPLHQNAEYLDVAELLVGPSSNKGLAARAAEDLRRISKCAIGAIHSSEIPLRLV